MTTTYPQLKATKPTGGFVFLTVPQLCLIWWAYRTRLIQLMDFRVWFAAHEMVARRCKLAPDQVPDYTPKELHGLVGGVGGEHLRASLRRLEPWDCSPGPARRSPLPPRPQTSEASRISPASSRCIRLSPTTAAACPCHAKPCASLLAVSKRRSSPPC